VPTTHRAHHGTQRQGAGLRRHWSLSNISKTNNAGYGHLISDGVIKLFSVVLAEVTRPGDTAERIGGDEFGLVLRGLEVEQIRGTLTQLQC
jgi:GGDEF domain-containing protein